MYKTIFELLQILQIKELTIEAHSTRNKIKIKMETKSIFCKKIEKKL
jgi:DNA-binding CsgD family transcriptional regulator